MKIGDKVRFLSDVGGGVVSGFQGKGIVLVEDADGFEIPTPIDEVVVVDKDDYSSGKMIEQKEKLHEQQKEYTSIRQQLSSDDTDELESEKDDDPSVGFVAKPKERSGGDLLSVYLAFVPQNQQNLSTTKFDAYIVNDSNYFIQFSYLSAEGASWHQRTVSEVEPNTKLLLEEFSYSDLNDLQHVAIQLFAYKKEKNFLLKPAVDCQLRVDTVKFYKLNTFHENDFFEQNALIYTIIENDRPSRPLIIDAEGLKQQMYSKPEKIQPARVKDVPKPEPKAKKLLKEDKIVVDLHANELLETTTGMSNSDILEYQMNIFRNTLEEYKECKGQKIIFIHGKGEGVLRHAIIHELNYKYKKYRYQDASFREYGYGATQVTIV
jgi:hypothetical protein